MKFFKKLFYLATFYYRYRNNIQHDLKKIDNYAGLVVKKNDANMLPQQELPKKIWTYWEGNTSSVLDKCFTSIQKANPDFSFVILNDKNLNQYCDIDWSLYPNLTPQLKADLIRLYLIYHYGGIWLDASIFVYKNFEWIQNLLLNYKVESFAFYRKANTTNMEYPIIESWLLAAIPKQEFFKQWYETFSKVLIEGVAPYINELKKDPNYKEITQQIKKLDYFIVYVVCQQVMREIKPNMVMIDCDQNALNYQVKNQWIRAKMLIDLALGKLLAEGDRAFVIKLTGKERKFLEKYCSEKLYLNDSLLDIN